MTITLIISGIVIIAILPILFVWLYQRQQIKDLDRAMNYLSHTAIQHHKDVKRSATTQQAFPTEFEKMVLKKATE